MAKGKLRLKILEGPVLHSLMGVLLFSLFWLNPGLGAPLWAGLGLYGLFFGGLLLLGRTSWGASFRGVGLLLLGIPLFRLGVFGAGYWDFPHDLRALDFYLLCVPVIAFLAVSRLIALLSSRIPRGEWGGAGIYLLVMSLLVSRRGWSLALPGENLLGVLLWLFTFFFLLGLLLLSGGGESREISLFPGLVVLLLLVFLSLWTVQKNYVRESLKEGGGLLESSLFRFDFSAYLRLESSISMKDDLVFLMRSQGGMSPYVRRFVLSGYAPGKGFFKEKGPMLEAPGQLGEDYLVSSYPRSWKVQDYRLVESVRQEYYLVNFDGSAFLGMNQPQSLVPFENWKDSSFTRVYQVDSLVSTAWGWELMEDPGPPSPASSVSTGKDMADFMDYYTNFGNQKDIQELTEPLIQGKESYYEKVKAIERYLKENYYYSLKPGRPAEGDALHYFLFDVKKGYCSYFAFAMTLMCRSVGIPARVALGFYLDGEREVLNFHSVKANQAHSWVEVYFPLYGWLAFDPTSQTPAPGEKLAFPPFSPSEVEDYLKEILENRDGLKVQRLLPSKDETGVGRNGLALTPGLLRFGAMAFGGGIFLLGILWTGMRILLLTGVMGLRGREKAAVLFRLHMMLAGYDKGPLQDFVNRRRNPELQAFFQSYEKIRFGRSCPKDFRHFTQQGRCLRHSLFRGASPTGKFLYLLRLFAPAGRRLPR